MRLLPHPVVILTAPPDRGITLSTLTCLSLHPYPLISFNVKTPSSCSAAMHREGWFVVHVLRSSPHAAHLANVFAQIGAPAGVKEGGGMWSQVLECEDVVGAEAAAAGDKSSSGSDTDGDGDAVRGRVIGRADGVVDRLWCEKVRVVQVEDHEIWVARVTEVERVADDGGDGGAGPGLGLMYVDRRFHDVGGEVVPEHGRLGEEVEVGAPEDE